MAASADADMQIAATASKKMAPETADGNIWGTLWYVIVAIASVMIGGFLYVLGLFREVDKKIEAKELLAGAADLRIWDRLDEQSKSSILLAIEQRFATKDYLTDQLRNMELRNSADHRAMFREHEKNVQDDIERRMSRERKGEAT